MDKKTIKTKSSNKSSLRKATVPVLNLHPLTRLNDQPKVKRCHSDGEIDCTSDRQRSLERLVVDYNATRGRIESINAKLDEICHKVLYEPSSTVESDKLNEHLKLLQNHLNRLVSSPKILSRCDALTVNTQLILKKIDQITEDVEGHDTCVISMLRTMTDGLTMINEQVMKLSMQMQQLETQLHELSTTQQ